MGVGDWLNATVSFLIGILLGSVAYGLAQLFASGSWLMAVILVVLGGGFFLFMVVADKLFDKVFPIGIRPAKNPTPQPSKPLLRVLGLPIGLMVGVVLAFLGLDGALLGFLA